MWARGASVGADFDLFYFYMHKNLCNTLKEKKKKTNKKAKKVSFNVLY